MDKINPIICIDGKRHYWKNKESGTATCQKCKSTTEYCFNPLRKQPWIRIVTNGQYNIKERHGSETSAVI